MSDRIFLGLGNDVLVRCAVDNAKLLNRVAVVAASSRAVAGLRSEVFSKLEAPLRSDVIFFCYDSYPNGHAFDIVLVSNEFDSASAGRIASPEMRNMWLSAFRHRLKPPREGTLRPEGH